LFDTPIPPDPVPEKVEVLVRGARVERTRDFGNIYLGLLLWQTLELVGISWVRPNRCCVLSRRSCSRRTGQKLRRASKSGCARVRMARRPSSSAVAVPGERRSGPCMIGSRSTSRMT
ncbi:MAG: hypothetical protein KAV00_10690, partial [Phycisphaerae bacterium]|nr:hypothetical protein [Phycisphaerae bacterium]